MAKGIRRLLLICMLSFYLSRLVFSVPGNLPSPSFYSKVSLSNKHLFVTQCSFLIPSQTSTLKKPLKDGIKYLMGQVNGHHLLVHPASAPLSSLNRSSGRGDDGGTTKIDPLLSRRAGGKFGRFGG